MNLFNRKTLKRHIKADPIPSDHLAALEAWEELITSGRIEGLKETALHGQFASKIVEGVLGYHGPAGGANYNVSTEQNILRGSVDLALGRFGGKTPDIVAPFELKGADTRDLDAIMSGRNKSPVQQAWEYAMNARGVKWVLVSNMIELRFYGFGEGTSAYEVFRLDQLTDPEEYARFMLLLSAENLLSGRTTDVLRESRREDKDITDSLYQDYKDLRLKLLSAVQNANTAIDPLDAIAVAQKILDRVLFIAFAEDTGLLPDNTLENAFVARDPYNPRPVWDNFKGLFRAIDVGDNELKIPRYNGGLFRQDDTISALSLPDDICEGFRTLGEYDFASEVSVTVLGHIFEQSIADVERLQEIARGEEVEPEKATGTTGRRKRDAERSVGNDVALSDQEIFGHLSLRALEMIGESWGRLIDPFWEQVKHEVRTSFAYDGIPQGYIALEQVLQKLEADYLNREVIREKMLAVLDEANRLSARHKPEIASRIAVAFFSEGVGEH